jgi:hypothetical protein
MPTYTFRNNNGEIEEHVMRISEHGQFVIDNPHLTQVHIDAPVLGDSVRLGITQPPSDFQKGVLGRIRDTYPGAVGLQSTRFKIPREH